MVVYFYAERFKSALESVCGRLVLVTCKNYAADIETYLCEHVEKTDNINVIGDAQVSADLVLLDVCRVYDYDYLCFVLKLEKHLEFTVRLKPRKHT